MKYIIEEKCKNCRKEFTKGIWLSAQFADEKVYLFCSEKCKLELLKSKLNRIKTSYPKFYEKLINTKGKDTIFEDALKE